MGEPEQAVTSPAAGPGAIAVVGNINLDIKTSTIRAQAAIFLDGETSVEEIYESFGGGAANAAVAAAALGGRVHFCGAVGKDALGDRLAQALREAGITERLARVDAPTGRSINLNWDNHNRHFVSSLPAARHLTFDRIDLAGFQKAGCRHLYRGDIWFGDDMLADGNRDLMRAARAQGMQTYLDLNYDPMWSLKPSAPSGPSGTVAEKVRWRIKTVTDMLRHVDYVHVNERELARFTGRADFRDGTRALIEFGAGAVILHRGARGSALRTADGQWIEAAAEPVESVVCETGTGDVFAAAFMVYAHLPHPERLAQANLVAARHLDGTAPLIGRLSG